MTVQTLGLSDLLATYLRSIAVRDHPILSQIEADAGRDPQGAMQIAPEQAQVLMLLVQLIQAKRTLEIGVFMGYSALAVALALPEQGQVVACESRQDYGQRARRYWRQAGVDQRIDLHLGPALETLETLQQSGQAGTFDFALIDGDKRNTEPYFEHCLTLVRPGGLIAIDNVLWYGRVADPQIEDKRTQTLRHFNQKVAQDSRVEISLLAIGDGMTLAWIKP